MTINYRKEQSLLIYDLIEESNPGFLAKYPPGSLTFSLPTAVAVTAGDPYLRDTTITATPVSGTNLEGSVTLKYRRLDMAVLFRDMVLRLTDYLESATYPKPDWYNRLSEVYGIKLVDADIPSNYTVMGTTQVTATIAPNSLCFKGDYQIQYSKGKKPISLILDDTKAKLVGRAFPGGNDFPIGRKPQGEFMTYAVDLSAIKTSASLDALASMTNQPAGATNIQMTSVIDELKKQTGRTDWNNGDSTVSGGLGGLAWYKYTLPIAAASEANSTDYNRVIVIQSVTGSWFSGKILLHWAQ